MELSQENINSHTAGHNSEDNDSITRGCKEGDVSTTVVKKYSSGISGNISVNIKNKTRNIW